MISEERSPNNQRLILLVLVLLALLLRISWLEAAPNTFSTDEASNGYDAYSILLTGRDRYGEFFPVLLRALNDSRESLYIYLAIPFIKFWGLNEFSIRLPAALAGVALVPTVYCLGQELFNSTKTALFAAFLITVSPWSIFYSRLAFRAKHLPLVFCWGLLFWLRSYRKPSYLVLSGLCFGLSLHTYAAARAMVPLFLLGLAGICFKHLIKHWQISLVAAALFCGIFGYLLQFWLAPEGSARVAETGLETNIFKLSLYYLSYLEPVFLFLFGDFSVRRSLTTLGIGQLYCWEMFTVFTALLSLKSEQTRTSKIIWLWLVLYPIPAALTEEQHAIRAIIGIPLFALISSYGFWLLWSRWQKNKQQLKQRVLIGAIALSLVYHGYAYYNYATLKISDTGVGHWQYGMKEAFRITENSEAQCVVISNKFKRPNLYLLFYTKYPPQEYQKNPDNPEIQYFEQPRIMGKYAIADITTYQPPAKSCLYMIEPKELTALQTIHPQLQEVKNIISLKGKSEILILN